MSGGYNYSRVSLAEQRRRALEAERRERERPRQIALERARQERARVERAYRRQQLTDQMDALAVTVGAVPADLRVPITAAMEESRAAVAAIGDDATLLRAQQSYDQLQGAVAAARLAAAERESDQNSQIASLRLELAALDKALSTAADSFGRHAAEHALGTLTPNSQQPDKFDAAYARVAQVLTAHLDATGARAAELRERAQGIATQSLDLGARVDAIAEDVEGSNRFAEPIRAVRRHLAAARAAGDRFQVARGRSELDKAQKGLEALETAVSEATLELDMRAIKVAALRDSLTEMGFVLDDAASSVGADDSVVIAARHASGWTLSAEVGARDAEGFEQIDYTIDDSICQIETGADGRRVVTCDTAEEMLGRVNVQMAQRGVLATTPRWRDKPRRPQGGGAAASHEQQLRSARGG